MAETTFHTLISGLDATWAGTTISGEAHVIPVSAPYAIHLHRIPKITTAGTSVFDNDVVSVADMALAGIAVTIAGSPATLNTDGNPSAGEVYFQILDATYAYSTKLVFNSADAGKAVSVDYVGYMSNLSGVYLQELFNAVARVETYPPCAVLSLNEYSAGRFDNTVADSTSVYVLGSRGDLIFTTGRYAWTTAAVDLTTGAAQVSAFTDVDGYKQVSLWLIDNSGTVETRITEGAEATTAETTTAPADYAGEAILCGTVIVQGDGTDNSVISNISKEKQLSLACSTQENNKDSRKRLDIVDTDKQADKTYEERKFWKVIHDILIKQKEPYEWHIDEIADEIGLDEQSDIKYLKEVMEEISMNQSSPIVSTTQNYTKFVYKQQAEQEADAAAEQLSQAEQERES